MQLPVQITFRNIEGREWVNGQINERAKKLEKFFDRITSCRVMVEIPHKHHHRGNVVQVRIDITVPDKEIVITRETREQPQPEHLGSTIKEAFEAAKRQLEDYARKRRGNVKTHEVAPRARIAKLFPEDEYGFIETVDGREIYFHANAVVNGKFDNLSVGNEVTYVEVQGDKGQQASTVKLATSPATIV